MKIKLNGNDQEIENGVNLDQLLQGLNLNRFTVVVERNEVVVRRDDLASTPVEEGDKIEIVKFVGGGMSETETPAQNKPQKPKKVKKLKETASKARKLVIVESPAKAKTINKYLGPEYQVEASMGHVRDLPKSKMGVDIENNFAPEYIVVFKNRKIVTHLKKQAKGKETIYLAPDPDREGEAISWHLAHIFGEVNSDATISRVVFNEITKDAVKEAFNHPREIMKNLVDAQQARRILDRVVGYELSPLLWKKVGRGLSAGRVQSVALRLIVEREREIKKFVPKEYWSIEAKLSPEKDETKKFISKLEKINGEKFEIGKRDDAEQIRQEILQQKFIVEKVDKHEKRRRPHAPYTTSKLQQESYNRLGFPAAKTMMLAQRLYEGKDVGSEGSVGLITYMRTDSVNIAKTAVEEAVKFIKGKYGKEYLPAEPPVYKSKKSAQEAHEAIRPTSVNRTPEDIRAYLEDDEFKLYRLIWNKFVASQMTPAVDEHVSISISAGEKYLFKTTGRRNIFPGFSILYEKDAAEEAREKEKQEDGEAAEQTNEPGDLPVLSAKDLLTLHELMGYQHFTKPPGRYNDASLVKLLEENGIGRPSTYAPTLYTLLSREYINRQGGALIPTELGITVTDMLVEYFPRVLDAQFTALMEDELDRVEGGEVDWVDVIKEFYGPFSEHLSAAREQMKNIRIEAEPTDHTCDICSKPMVIKWGRFGKFMACSGFPDCKYTRSIPTGFRCPEPNCGGDIVKRKSKNRRTFFGCSKYPKCTYITNKLPKKDEGITEDDKIPEIERETLGP